MVVVVIYIYIYTCVFGYNSFVILLILLFVIFVYSMLYIIKYILYSRTMGMVKIYFLFPSPPSAVVACYIWWCWYVQWENNSGLVWIIHCLMRTMRVVIPLQLPSLFPSLSSVVADCYIWWCWYVRWNDNNGLGIGVLMMMIVYVNLLVEFVVTCDHPFSQG